MDTVNHHYEVLQLEPLEVCYHRVIGVGYVLFSVATCTIYNHHNVIYLFFPYYGFYFSLWLKPWLLFPVDDKVKYLQYLVD